MELAKLIEECKATQAQSHKVFIHESYYHLGRYYLNEITLEEMNELNKTGWDRHSHRCNEALNKLAAESRDPLTQWIAANVPNKKTALHLIKKLPLDLEGIDKAAQRNKWCSAYYTKHRPQAVADGVVFEYKEE